MCRGLCRYTKTTLANSVEERTDLYPVSWKSGTSPQVEGKMCMRTRQLSAASSPLTHADAPCRSFKSALRSRWRGRLKAQRPRRRACVQEPIRTTVEIENGGNVPIPGSSPLTTRHRYAISHEGENARRVRRLPMAHYKPRSTLRRPCFPRTPLIRTDGYSSRSHPG